MFIPANSAYVSQLPNSLPKPSSSSHAPSSHAPSSKKKRKAKVVEDDDELTAEEDLLDDVGQEAEVEEGAGDDETLYCYCKQKSFGEVRPPPPPPFNSFCLFVSVLFELTLCFARCALDGRVRQRQVRDRMGTSLFLPPCPSQSPSL